MKKFYSRKWTSSTYNWSHSLLHGYPKENLCCLQIVLKWLSASTLHFWKPFFQEVFLMHLIFLCACIFFLACVTKVQPPSNCVIVVVGLKKKHIVPLNLLICAFHPFLAIVVNNFCSQVFSVIICAGTNLLCRYDKYNKYKIQNTECIGLGDIIGTLQEVEWSVVFRIFCSCTQPIK